MTNWMPDAAQLRRPIYLSLAEQIGAAIAAGVLPSGGRLPTHRRLALDLGVSIQTVSRAYEEAARRGYISGETGRGTFVRAPPASEPAQPFIAAREGGIIDLSMLKPVLGSMHLEHASRALRHLADDLPAQLISSFRPNVVFSRHRQIAVEWLRECGLHSEARNVVLTNGATSAMNVALMTALRPGDLLATDLIAHHTLAPLAAYLGVELTGLAMDDEGMLPAALQEACDAAAVRAVFLLPNASNPSVTMMGEARRAALVDVARRNDLQVIENDAWGPLIERRPPPIAAMAPERTHYLTSFSKILAPGIRLGYLVVPERFMPAASNRHLVTNWMATSLMAEIASRWVEDGTAMEMVAWQRRALRDRQAMAAQILADQDYRAHAESMHLWLQLPEGRKEEEVVSLARLQGVAVAPGSAFALGPHAPALRVCLGQPSETELRHGLSILGSILRSEPEPVLLTL